MSEKLPLSAMAALVDTWTGSKLSPQARAIEANRSDPLKYALALEKIKQQRLDRKTKEKKYDADVKYRNDMLELKKEEKDLRESQVKKNQEHKSKMLDYMNSTNDTKRLENLLKLKKFERDKPKLDMQHEKLKLELQDKELNIRKKRTEAKLGKSLSTAVSKELTDLAVSFDATEDLTNLFKTKIMKHRKSGEENKITRLKQGFLGATKTYGIVPDSDKLNSLTHDVGIFDHYRRQFARKLMKAIEGARGTDEDFKSYLNNLTPSPNDTLEQAMTKIAQLKKTIRQNLRTRIDLLKAQKFNVGDTLEILHKHHPNLELIKKPDPVADSVNKSNESIIKNPKPSPTQFNEDDVNNFID